MNKVTTEEFVKSTLSTFNPNSILDKFRTFRVDAETGLKMFAYSTLRANAFELRGPHQYTAILDNLIKNGALAEKREESRYVWEGVEEVEVTLYITRGPKFDEWMAKAEAMIATRKEFDALTRQW